MINFRTAKRIAVKVLWEEKCLKLVEGLEWGVCLNETFEDAVKTLGKKRTAEIYKKLPKQLKTYILWELTPGGDKRFSEKFIRLWDAYSDLHGEDHPNRYKDFKNYYREAEEALLKYLKPR